MQHADDIENVIVTAYNNIEGNCVISNWLGEDVNVRCYDADDEPADMAYLIAIIGRLPGSTTSVVGQALAADETDSSYEPLNVYNAGGGDVTASRTDVGTYSVAFDGLNLNAGANIHVDSYGLGRRCGVAAWAGNTVNVTCTNTSGTLQDSPYSIVVFQD